MKVTKPSRVRLSPSTRDTEEEESEESSEESRLAELGSRMPGHTDKVNTMFTCTHRNQTRLRRCFQDKSTAKLRKPASYYCQVNLARLFVVLVVRIFVLKVKEVS